MKYIAALLFVSFIEAFNSWVDYINIQIQNFNFNLYKGIDIQYDKSGLLFALISISESSNNVANTFGVIKKALGRTAEIAMLDKKHFSYFGHIAIFENMGTIFVAQGFARNMSGGSCNERDTTGCHELALFEFTMRGAVPSFTIRRNQFTLDAYHRVCPSIEYLTLRRGRPYLFYLRYNESVPWSTIAYITRSPVFEKFTAEMILFPERRVNYGLTSFITYSFDDFQINLAWFENTHDLMFTSSTDGLIWREPSKIQEGVDVSPLYSYTSFVRTNPKTRTLYLSYFGRDKSGQIIISEDNGETWSEPYQTTEPESESLDAVFCANKIYVSSIRFQKPYISVFNVKSKTVISLTPPFRYYGSIGSLQISCFNTSSEINVAAFGVTSDSTKATIQLYKARI